MALAACWNIPAVSRARSEQPRLAEDRSGRLDGFASSGKNQCLKQDVDFELNAGARREVLAMQPRSDHLKRSVNAASPSLVEAAIGYAREGMSVFPVKSRGKSPLTKHGWKDATIQVEEVAEWWRKWPAANIGLAIPRGIVVVDLDSSDALGYLRANNLSLPATATAITGRGRHFWYSVGSAAVGNRVDLLPNVDIRAWGGYVVAPPSVHPSGAVYSWETSLKATSIAECPEWLIQKLAGEALPHRRTPTDWSWMIGAPVLEGRRNQSLAQVAGLLLRYLPDAKIAAEVAACWAREKLSPPLPENEVRQTIESIAGRELRRRGGGA